MTDLAKLVVKLEAQTGKYQRDLERANKKLDGFARNTKKSMGNIKAAFAGLAVGAFIREIGRATAQSEQALAQLEQGLKSTSKAAGFSKDQLVGFAEELQKATTFGDEDIINAQANLLTFTNIAGEQFKRTTEAALNLSTRVGQDLKSSVIQLGKALNDPVANLGALSRSGIQFSKDQKEVIKALSESGRLAEAQTLILNELEVQYGGAARAARDTFSGALEGLKNAFGDLLESSGGLKDSQKSLEEFTDLLQDPATLAAANTLTTALISSFGFVTKAIMGAVTAAKDFGEWMARITGGATLEVEELDKSLINLRNDLAAFDDGTPAYGVKAETIANLKAEIAELEKLKALANDLAKDQERRAASGSPSASGVPSIDVLSPIIPGGKKIKNTGKEYLDKLEMQRKAQFDSVVAGLRTEEEVLLDSYHNRHDIIMSSTEATEEEKKALIVRLNDETLQEVETSVTKLKENVAEKGETQAEAFDRLFGAGALTSLFSDLDNIEDRFKSLLANIAAQALASGISNMFAQGGASGSFTGGISSFIGGLFGGAKADGGPVSAGKIHLVGEKGPEMFVPNVGGSIVPNNQLGGNTSVVINLPNIKDTDTFRKSSGQIAAQYRNEIARAGRNA